MAVKGTLRIGTSGIVVPGSKEDRAAEFKNKSRLTYYNSFFNTLEVNSTFKKIPRASTLVKWSNEVSSEFQFTIKLWREITHVKKLEIKFGNIDTFMSAINRITTKKGCLLIQLPASITHDYKRQVQQILQRLHKLDKKNTWRKAVEFRSTTWYNEKIFKLLEKYHASLVLHDIPKSNNLKSDIQFSFAYFRFHGPAGDYKGSYTEEFLREQSNRISALLMENKDVYVYFNNTMGSAFQNAMALKETILENVKKA
jgi:uncharacterized protein YecE (DUF72 family)